MFVVNFNEKVSLGLPTDVRFSDSVKQLGDAIGRAPASGMTALYDAIVEARAALARLRELPQRLSALEQRVNDVLGSGGGFGAAAGAMSLTRAHGALATLYEVLEDADVTPTAQTRQQVDEYTTAMKRLVTQWQAVKADYQAQVR